MATIQGIYLALFGRPADPDGLVFWNNQTSGGLDLTAILSKLPFTAEYQARFNGKSNTQIVTDIYQSLFNRGPDAAGLADFVAKLNNGTETVERIAVVILDGAQGSDKALIDKKLAAAQLFTNAINTDAEKASYNASAIDKAKAYLTGVTATSTTLTTADADAAVAGLSGTVTPPTTGVTINLVTGNETVSPAQADPAFKSTENIDTINAPAGTFTSNINIDGGGAVDSLFATRTASGTVTPTITNVEKLFVTGQTGNTVVDLKNVTGLTEVWSKNTAFPGATVDFTNIKVGTNIGVEGPGDNIFDFDNTAAPGTADSVKLMVKQATSNRIGIDQEIETVNLENEGTSNLQFVFSSAFTTMNATGSGNLTLTAMPNTIRVFDASGLNGSVTAPDMHSTNGVKITGSKQADTFALLSTNNVQDVIVFNAGNISTFSSSDTYTGFDAGTSTTSEDKIDVSAFNLTGGKTAITTFNTAPTDGASFNSNAVAVFPNNTVYVDSNNDGKYNAATDLVFNITGSATSNLDVSDFIF